MSNIPGLNFCPNDDRGGGIHITSFNGTVFVPESHLFGNCHRVHEFEKLNTISEGSFGVIYKCRSKKTNEYYSLKRSKMSSLFQNGIPSSMLREISLLGILEHENIVKYHGTIAGRNLENNYLILDYCPLSLNNLIEKEVNAIYETDVVKYIMQQIFLGLLYIHEALVIHRDINGENIVFTEKGVLKITGFHASRFYSKGNMTPDVSEVTYRAPELLFQAKKYGPPVDIWSAGCIFARLLLKKPLFSGNSELEVLRSIFDVLGTPSENIWPGFCELFSLMEEVTSLVEKSKPYNDLKHFFGDHPLSCQDLIKDVLLYYPDARLKAEDCLKSTYATESPEACSQEKFSAILKNVLTTEEHVK